MTQDIYNLLGYMLITVVVVNGVIASAVIFGASLFRWLSRGAW